MTPKPGSERTLKGAISAGSRRPKALPKTARTGRRLCNPDSPFSSRYVPAWHRVAAVVPCDTCESHTERLFLARSSWTILRCRRALRSTYCHVRPEPQSVCRPTNWRSSKRASLKPIAARPSLARSCSSSCDATGERWRSSCTSRNEQHENSIAFPSGGQSTARLHRVRCEKICKLRSPCSLNSRVSARLSRKPVRKACDAFTSTGFSTGSTTGSAAAGSRSCPFGIRAAGLVPPCSTERPGAGFPPAARAKLNADKDKARREA